MKLRRAISAAVITAFVALLFFVVRPRPMRIEVKFITLTNLTSMDVTNYNLHPLPCANFWVSNAGKCSVLELPFCRFDYKYDAAASGVEWGGMDNLKSELKPGESKTVSITALGLDQDEGPWRVSLSFYKIGWKYRLLTHSPPWLFSMLPEKWSYQYHHEQFQSDWVPEHN